MAQVEFRGALLTTSSALALILGIGGSAQAATCTINNQTGAVNNAASINCISFNNGTTFSGPVTNAATGTLSGGGTVVPTNTGITVVGGSTVTGSITNSGTISAAGFGINIGIGVNTFTNGGTVGGSITNDGTIHSAQGITVQGGTVTGTITNTVNGVISLGSDTGIGVVQATVGSIVNDGKINRPSQAGINVSESTVNGSITNSSTGTIVDTNGSAGIAISNGGTINGDVTNAGSITSKNAGIIVFPNGAASGTPSSELITGSIINTGTITLTSANGFGIALTSKTPGFNNTVNGNIENRNSINSSFTGIAIQGSSVGATTTIHGSVINSGTITTTVSGSGIGLLGHVRVDGDVTNSGTITASAFAGIGVASASIGGTITNTSTGQITAPTAVGILISDFGLGPATITGGILNQGSINAVTGIMVTGSSTVTGGITNSGTITGTGGTAIDVTGEGAATTINQQGGTITGNILLSTLADTVNITGGALSGNIVGQGTSNTVNFAVGAGNTFTYANAITGVNAVNVNSGILDLTGSIASTLTTVNSGGELMGTGTVGTTTVASNGVFAPGSGTPGTFMTVSGNLAFASGALYMVQLNPATASFASVTGTATLGGATVNAVYANGSYVAKQYTILTATGGVSGTFGSLVNTNLPANFKTSLSYDAHDAFLNLTLSFVPPPNGGLNQNQQNVANAIVGFFNSTGSIPLVFGGLTPAGLSQAAGETATGSQQTTFNAMGLFMGLLTDPFIGSGGAGTGGPGATPFAAESDGGNAYAAKDPSRSKSERDAYAAIYRKAPVADTFTQRWSVWAAAYGGSQTTDGNTALGSNNTTSSIAGTAVGADYRFSPYTLAGFALAGGGTNFNVNGFGSGHSDLFQAGAYVRHTAGPAYISAALAYGWQDITTNRTVTIAGIDQLQAHFNANAFSGRAEGGYRFVTPWMGVTPYAAAQFTTFDLPAYAEQAIVGSNTFALAYGSKSVTDTRSELGIRTDKSWAMTDSIFTLRGRFAWAHDYDPNRSIGATFQTLPGASFVVNGAVQAHDSALTTASAEVKWTNGWSAAATFEGEFSQVTRSYAGKGVVRYTW